MPFQVEQQVVHPTHGVGSVQGLVMKTFSDSPARQYYEIAIEHGTVWVPVATGPDSGLRSLTPRTALTHYRGVLTSRPTTLTPDHRQRHLELQQRLKPGLFQNLCEVARDLSARGWHKTLSETDSARLRQVRHVLCQEWAAADGVSIADATVEVNGLLLEGQRAFQN